MAQCIVCGLEGSNETLFSHDTVKVECKRCGEYEILRHEWDGLKDKEMPTLGHVVSAWIREQNMEYGKWPLLTLDVFLELMMMHDKPLKSKFEKFMEAVDIHLSDTESDRMIYPLEKPAWFSVTWSKDCDELLAIVEEAITKGLIQGEKRRSRIEGGCDWYFNKVSITFKGREFVESLGQMKGNSNKVFLAFHFTDEMKESFEKTTKKAVDDASNGKLEAVRVSTSGTSTDTKIDDALIAMLKVSKAVIADFTGQRQAVYYEAGYAMGLGIPVIWTCRKDEEKELSFDTRQYPHILWQDEEDLYKQLTDRLSAQIL